MARDTTNSPRARTVSSSESECLTRQESRGFIRESTAKSLHGTGEGKDIICNSMYEIMPRSYRFEAPVGSLRFTCPLICSTCRGTKVDGSRCTRTVCIGTEYCWQHLAAHAKLKIAPSSIPGGGKGLFAWLTPKNRALQPDSDVVFEKDARIIRYEGEVVTDQELRRRYGDKTAPYAAGERGLYIDGACQRSAGSMANGSNKNHKHNAVYAVALGPRTIFLRANKNIRHGEEILCSYGQGYWSGVKGTSSRTR
jgi:hypothetical protein